MTTRRNSKTNNWSAKVTKESNAMDLESGVFTWLDPKKIARSLKKSVENSNRIKTSPFRSAMSMLNFYINRAGTNLSKERIKILNEAKGWLRILFNKNN
jgi:hypothetical protein